MQHNETRGEGTGLGLSLQTAGLGEARGRLETGGLEARGRTV